MKIQVSASETLETKPSAHSHRGKAFHLLIFQVAGVVNIQVRPLCLPRGAPSCRTWAQGREVAVWPGQSDGSS